MTHRKIDKSVVDPDDSFTNLFNELLPKSIQEQIHSSAIGKITKYNKKKHVCDVQILPLDSDNSKVAALNEVLVPEYIWRGEEIIKRQNEINKLQNQWNAAVAERVNLSYTDIWKNKPDQTETFKKFFKVGSVVTVGFLDRELDNYQNNNSNYKIETDRMHSLNDAFIIGVVKS